MKHAQRGVSLYLVALIVGATGLGGWGVLAWDKSRLAAAHKAGHAQAMKEVRAARQAAENHSLLLQQEQIINLTNELTEARNAYDKTKGDLATARAAARRSGERVRNTAAPGGDLEQRLAAAECAVARTFGAGAFRTAQSCRDAVEELGFGPGGLVESSASAHHERARADALMRFSMPRSPFKTKE